MGTSTSSFGVGRRESHDASDFYARFEAPEISDDDTLGTPGETRRDPRRRCPRHAPRARRVGGPRGHVAAVLRRQGVRDGARRGPCARRLHRVPHDAARRLRRVGPHARTRRSDRRQRRQPRPPPVPQPRRRRHVDPAGRPPPAAARRGGVAEAARRERVVRLGVVPLAGQPGAARHHRAGDHRQQGSLRPRRRIARPSARRRHDARRRVHGGDARRVGDRRRERHARRSPGAVPGRARRALPAPVHVRR